MLYGFQALFTGNAEMEDREPLGISRKAFVAAQIGSMLGGVIGTGTERN